SRSPSSSAVFLLLSALSFLPGSLPLLTLRILGAGALLRVLCFLPKERTQCLHFASSPCLPWWPSSPPLSSSASPALTLPGWCPTLSNIGTWWRSASVACITSNRRTRERPSTSGPNTTGTVTARVSGFKILENPGRHRPESCPFGFRQRTCSFAGRFEKRPPRCVCWLAQFQASLWSEACRLPSPLLLRGLCLPVARREYERRYGRAGRGHDV